MVADLAVDGSQPVTSDAGEQHRRHLDVRHQRGLGDLLIHRLVLYGHRRKPLILAQLWMLWVAGTLALLAHLALLGPWILIALTLALGLVRSWQN